MSSLFRTFIYVPQAFVVADRLRSRLEYAHALTKSMLELNLARFPFDSDAAGKAGLRSSVDELKTATSTGELRLEDEDSDMVALADRCVHGSSCCLRC